MSSPAEPGHPGRYDGLRGDDIAEGLALPHAVIFDTIGSTLDVAHALAEEGAPAGTLVLADAQSAGRGRQGRTWHSERGAGIWLTLVERPSDVAALDVLSLRIGLGLARALDAFATEAIRLKWPNDLFVGDRKLGGILVEARWRAGSPEWVAIGVGVNVRAPSGEARATGLRDDAVRLAVLEAIVPAIRTAAACVGPLDESELRAFAERDLAAGRRCVEPVTGTVRGIDASGALLVHVPSDEPRTVAVRSGSLLLEETP
ncbi:MAG: biotin/acetyl-CoA-carboxylase ligase [Gemmatimonadetes bacterium]|nr:biotin/acetyl-CoA-carboxylase ligase [Gemmatimonadota bacterium]